MAVLDEIRKRSHVDPIESEKVLEDWLAQPAPKTVETVGGFEGDVLVLGAGGRLGVNLCALLCRAQEVSGNDFHIYAVAPEASSRTQRTLKTLGVDLSMPDLSDEEEVAQLPDAAYVFYLLGREMGPAEDRVLAWALNVRLAAYMAERYRHSRLIVFSSGVVYPTTPSVSGGARENAAPMPVGEYAMSCLARERMFDYAADLWQTPVLHCRLSHAVELRYGILRDIAHHVWTEQPVDLGIGHFNAVWQGYASNVAVQAVALARSPSAVLNVTGPETLSPYQVALRLGEIMGKSPVFEGSEPSQAVLLNAAGCFRAFGYPQIALDTLLEWTGYWVAAGREYFDEPLQDNRHPGAF